MTDMMSQRNRQENSLRNLYYVLYRHKTRVLASFFCIVALVSLYTLLASEVYRSDAKLMVNLGRESVSLDPTATTGQIVPMERDRESEINSEIELLNNRELAENVVDAFGVDNFLNGPEETPARDAPLLKVISSRVKGFIKLPFSVLGQFVDLINGPDPNAQAKRRDMAVQTFVKTLKVEGNKKSNIISMSYEALSARQSKEIIEKTIGFYLENHINAHRTKGSYQFFDRQKENLQVSLAQTEEDLRGLKNKTGTASIQEQRHILLERIGGVQRELEETESSAAASAARVKALKASIAGLPGTLQKDETTGFANSAADGMRKQIYDLQLKEQELLSTFTENSIPVEEVRRQIREGRALLSKAEQQKQVTRGINENYQKMQLDLLTEESNLSSLQARAQVLKTQLERGRGELNNLNDTEMRLAQLERALEEQKSQLHKYSDSRDQARIDEALEMGKISNISVVQAASYPVKPIRPKVLLNLAMGLFLGVLGGIGLAFLAEHLDHTLKRVEDVETTLDLPVLAALPHIEAANGTGGLHAYDANLTETREKLKPSCGFGEGNSLGGGVLCYPGGDRDLPRVIGLTSCNQGEGVSTVGAQLALEIAKNVGGRVLLVDANLRFPGQQLKFGIKLSPGLIDLVSNGRGGANYIQSTKLENLDLLTAGDGNRSLLLSEFRRLADSIPALRREYSHIIFDLPALSEDSPAIHCAALMDGALLVVEAEATRREVVTRAKEELLKANVNLLGVILNKRRLHIPEWLYRRL